MKSAPDCLRVGNSSFLRGLHIYSVMYETDSVTCFMQWFSRCGEVNSILNHPALLRGRSHVNMKYEQYWYLTSCSGSIIMFSLIIIQIYSKQICRLPRVEEWDASQRRATILLWWLWSLIKRYFAQRHIVNIQQSSLSFHTDCASTRSFFQFSRLLISKGI